MQIYHPRAGRRSTERRWRAEWWPRPLAFHRPNSSGRLGGLRDSARPGTYASGGEQGDLQDVRPLGPARGQVLTFTPPLTMQLNRPYYPYMQVREPNPKPGPTPEPKPKEPAPGPGPKEPNPRPGPRRESGSKRAGAG